MFCRHTIGFIFRPCDCINYLLFNNKLSTNQLLKANVYCFIKVLNIRNRRVAYLGGSDPSSLMMLQLSSWWGSRYLTAKGCTFIQPWNRAGASALSSEGLFMQVASSRISDQKRGQDDTLFLVACSWGQRPLILLHSTSQK